MPPLPLAVTEKPKKIQRAFLFTGHQQKGLRKGSWNIVFNILLSVQSKVPFLGWACLSLCHHCSLLSVYLVIYLFVWMRFATFVMNDVTRHKTWRNVQVTQEHLSSVIFFHDYGIRFVVARHGFSDATINLESSFVLTFPQTYVLRMFENVLEIKKPQCIFPPALTQGITLILLKAKISM